MAKAALSSKKRAIVAGPGNPPVVVDETACMNNTAQSIIAGGAYDNNLLCIGEKEVFVVNKVFNNLMSAMGQHGGYQLNAQQVHDLEQAAFETTASGKHVLRKELVGKDPAVLARSIGMSIPAGTQLLFGETNELSPLSITSR